MTALVTAELDTETGDYVPPIRVDTMAAVKDVVMQCDAVGAAPLALIAREVRAGQLCVLPLRLDWMRTRYGFVHLRERQLTPAALAFMSEVRSVEAELSGLAEHLRLVTEPHP